MLLHLWHPVVNLSPPSSPPRFCLQSSVDFLQVVVENSFGEVGLCPGNHLDPNPDFCGRALFDIERLLTYKTQTEKAHTEPTNSGPKSTGPKPELKFFDPLRSPDDEMLKIEAELERKAREANAANVQKKIVEAKPQVPGRTRTLGP